MVSDQNFFLGKMGCFFDLGLETVAGCVIKRR
jgi:hypothetical protein